ncbi:MAG: alcohol dehydrogenase catalytic domain-containing protein [Planctomycetota bacterium]
MRGLVIERGRVTLRNDLPEPVPPPGESLVQVLLAGICATDLALARGYIGFAGVPGHEFVGRALSGPLAGQRVVGEINAGCGRAECPECRREDPRHCPRRTVLGILGRSGAFAGRLVLPDRNLHAVPDSVSDEQAVFAEPWAAALHAAEQLPAVRGQRVLVAGDGRLGLLCAHALARAGAHVTVAGRHPERTALLPAGARLVTGWLEAEIADGRTDSFPYAVEATGRPETLARLLARVAPRGTIVLKTTCETPAPLDLAPLVVNEQALIGSRCGRMAPAIAALRDNPPPIAAFGAERFPLSDAVAALAHASKRGVLKVLLDV